MTSSERQLRFSPAGKTIFLILIAAGLFVSGCAGEEEESLSKETGTDAVTESTGEGWETVFDGETLDGWQGLNMDEVPSDYWMAEDGILKKIARDSVPEGPDGERPPTGDLLLDRPVTNFEFSFEWKLEKGGNSGVKYNVSEELSAAHGNPHSALGFEYQVLDNPEYPDLEENPSWSTAGLYELVEPGPNARINPAGEWNSGRIVFNGNHGEHWLNGERVLTYELDSDELQQALEESKWSHIPEFGQRHNPAYIILQDHSDAVWYRNIKLKELP